MSGFAKGVLGFLVGRPLIAIAIAVVVVGLLLFGVWPNRLLELARSAVETVQPTATTAVTPP